MTKIKHLKSLPRSTHGKDVVFERLVAEYFRQLKNTGYSALSYIYLDDILTQTI
jgi:hypothetical protein